METQERRCWVGLDWGDTRHAVCVLDEAGKLIESFELPHTAVGLEELVSRLRSCGAIGGVAVEKTRHLVVQKLLEAGLTVYAINPKLSKSWRDGESVSAAKDDLRDAFVLAEGLRQRHERLRELRPDEPLLRELRLLCADECRLIADRTALSNRLKATLKEYYPDALGWFDDWTKPTSWDFVLTFPTAGELARAKSKKIYGFLRSHHIGLHPTWQQRVEGRTQTAPWPSDPATVAAKSLLAISLAKGLRTLEASLEEYRERIGKLFGDQPDSGLFGSLPGAGDKLAPRLLTHFGTDRQRFESSTDLELLSGTVPVLHQSGKSRHVRMRHACRKDFRTALHQFAFLSIGRSAWARAFYDQARRKGQSFALALRNLARKWLRIIYRMWQERRPYKEGRYIAALIRRRSPLVQEIQNLQPLTGGG